MNAEELAIRQKLKDDYPHFASRCLKIRTKTGSVEPLIFNKAQLYLDAKANEQLSRTGKIRILGLKGRQQGFSTYVEGRAYWRTSWNKGIRAFILTHEEEATKNLFEMANRYHENNNPLVKPHTGAANANELKFDLLESDYKVGTARTKGTGRGGTIQFFHGSEVAFWPNAEEHAAGVMQSIPDMPGTEVFLESTANGIGNYFHSMWQDAEAGISDYIPVFVPWYWQDEYQRDITDFKCTPEEAAYRDYYGLNNNQMAWRRAKIIELKSETLFKQEYPATATEAFQVTGIESLIKSEFILKARKSQQDPNGPLVVGVDPAGEGKDRTAIAFRRGRKCTKIDTFQGKSPMEVVSICAKILKNHNPAVMFIDVGERGVGIVDRLRELGWDNVQGVNFGSRANNPDIYNNRRIEMWCLLRDWLEEGLVAIPDDDALHADLSGPSYKTDSNNRTILEKKEDMKKRGIRSPDMADALALTFAAPVSEARKPIPQHQTDYFGV